MSRRAFTLVELVVTIGLVIVLAGLTLSVSVAIVQGSEARQTEMTLRLLETALREWEVQSERQVTYGKDDEPFTNDRYEIQEEAAVPDEDESQRTTAELLAIISRSASARQILSRIDPDFMIEEEDAAGIRRMKLFDPWGKKIYCVFPGRAWVQGDSNVRDADGTIRTQTEDLCGVAKNRQICFVSPGPDGRLGDLSMDKESEEFQEARDNLYSYEPGPPVADTP